MKNRNKLLHKKTKRSLHPPQGVLDLCGSMYESHDDARFAHQGN